MEEVIDEILQEIKEKCDNDMFQYLKNIIIVKLNGYKLIKEETGLIKYKMSNSEKWFKMFFISKKLQGLSERSLKYYQYTLKQALRSINKPLDVITSDDIKYYLACYQLTGKPNQTTIDNMRRVLNTFFQWLEDEEYIIKNPIKKIKKGKIKKTLKRAFTFEEIEKLKMACKDKREIAIVDFLLSTGARAEETTNVKKSDVNFENGTVLVLGKGNKERMVYLNASALLRLKDYLSTRTDSSPYIFVGMQKPHNKISVCVIETTVRKIGKRAYVENVHPHRFRRTCATIASKRGMHIEEIQRMLGHEDLKTTQIYVQVDESDIRKSHEKYMN